MILARRKFLIGLGAASALIAAPAIVHATSLMRVAVPKTLAWPSQEELIELILAKVHTGMANEPMSLWNPELARARGNYFIKADYDHLRVNPRKALVVS